jgi:hypothetical protein
LRVAEAQDRSTIYVGVEHIDDIGRSVADEDPSVDVDIILSDQPIHIHHCVDCFHISHREDSVCLCEIESIQDHVNLERCAIRVAGRHRYHGCIRCFLR